MLKSCIAEPARSQLITPYVGVRGLVPHRIDVEIDVIHHRHGAGYRYVAEREKASAKSRWGAARELREVADLLSGDFDFVRLFLCFLLHKVAHLLDLSLDLRA